MVKINEISSIFIKDFFKLIIKKSSKAFSLFKQYFL